MAQTNTTLLNSFIVDQRNHPPELHKCGIPEEEPAAPIGGTSGSSSHSISIL